MKLFRNPEIRTNTMLYLLITVIAVCAGFFTDINSVIISVILGIAFALVHLSADYFRYQKISDLSYEINKILHGQDQFDLSRYAEGELSILQSQILKMTVQLREQASILKNDKVFLTDSIADISHQIKTPLTSINLITSLLAEPDLSNERRMELTAELMRTLSHVEWLISTLLKISKFDAGTVVFQKEEVPVEELIKKAANGIAISMDLRNQKLITEIGSHVTYTGDMAWSAEAVENILKNCMEHTPNGGQIEVSASENAIYSEIIIKDNGGGIEKEDLPHLFERFYKGANASSESVGIGLALANMIVIKQNGIIKAENNKDFGAKFTVRFYKCTV